MLSRRRLRICSKPTIYNQEASRGFVDSDGHVVMLMVAYGESQSDRLQLAPSRGLLHRAGLPRLANQRDEARLFPLGPAAQPDALVAQREERVEPISYWMRIGYDNANGNLARQALKLGYGLRGWVPDGVLFRVSTIGVPAELSFKIQDKFIHDLLNAVDPSDPGIHGRRPEERRCCNRSARLSWRLTEHDRARG